MVDFSGLILTGGAVHSIAYDNAAHRVFFGSFDHILYCLNSNGELEWSYTAEDKIYGVAFDSETNQVFL